MNWIYPYYNQKVYKSVEEKFNYASKTYLTTYLDYTETPMTSVFYIEQTSITIFDNLWFDLSGLDYFDLSHH